MYKLFLTLRYLRKRRIAYFAIAAVILCTAMVLIVMSVMGGFLDHLKNKARGMLGDVVVANRSYRGFPLYQEYIDQIMQWPEIEYATPLIYSYGILRFSDTPQTNTVRVVGLELEGQYRVNDFKSCLYYEKHYPGTTHLAPQQQPLLGFDPERSERVETEDGAFLLMPVLPEKFANARQQARAADIVDDDTAPTSLDRYLARYGQPPIPGVFDVNSTEDEAGLRRPTYTGDPHPGLIIGRDIIADRLPDGRYERREAYPRGCLLALTLVPVTDTGTVELPVKQPFRYADDSRTGIYEIDSQHVYCDFELLQKLLFMDQAELVGGGTAPARCSQIQIKLADGVDADRITRRLEEQYHTMANDPRYELPLEDRMLVSDVSALTWEQSQAHIIGPVEKERQLVTILFGIISLVAVVLVLCILYMIVLQKTRDIGIIKSIGGSSRGVALIFIIYGAAVGIVGSVVGAVLGYLFVTNINEIQAFLTYLNPAWQVWDRSVYSFDEIPHTVRTEDIITVIIAAILSSTLGALIPAVRAGSMHPVEALRHE